MKFTIISHAGFFGRYSPREEYMWSLEQAKLADELGYDRWLHTEHHLSSYGGGGVVGLLGAVARETENIRIGTMVILSPLYNPVIIAEDTAVLDILSNGRLEVGLGRGYRPHTMEVLSGHPMSDMRGMHEETIETVKLFWTQDEVSYKGKFYRFENETVEPKPVQSPHPPLLQPALSPESFGYLIENGVNPIVGAHGVTDDITIQYMTGWKETVRQMGTGADLEVGNQQFCYVAPTSKAAHEDFAAVASYCLAFRADLPDDYNSPVWTAYRNELLMLSENTEEAAHRSIVGDPQEVIERLKFYEELGVDNMILFMEGLDLPKEKIERSMNLFAEKVMPHFK